MEYILLSIDNSVLPYVRGVKSKDCIWTGGIYRESGSATVWFWNVDDEGLSAPGLAFET